MSVVLTRKVHFCASHRYHNPEFSDEENRRIFGKCNHPNGHGHNYLCEVSVIGDVDPATGMVIDLKKLSVLLDAVIMERYDHKNLNLDVPEFAKTIPTSENIAIDIWRHLEGRLEGCRLHRIRLYEDPTLFVEYLGE
ncbi:MAG: 6-carboxytetrahydropterin synthase [Armatimonadetes bacterium]|nr:6-carboxytetrahydropterin synthase [Armatimonadota bacterium]